MLGQNSRLRNANFKIIIEFAQLLLSVGKLKSFLHLLQTAFQFAKVWFNITY